MKKYILVSLVISAGMSVSRALQYDINVNMPESFYPISFVQNLSSYKWQTQPRFVAIFVLNIVYNLVTYLVFVLIHFVIDVVMCVKLWRVIGEKQEKQTEMLANSGGDLDTAIRVNDESRRRAILMVIFNSTLNFSTKMPLLITSLNDFRLLVQRPYFLLESQSPSYFVILHQLKRFESSFMTLNYYLSLIHI